MLERQRTSISSDVSPGTFETFMHGNCPVCKHWHNKFTVRISRMPGVFSGIRCERCNHKMFGIGGNSTHTSLLSQISIDPIPSGSQPFCVDRMTTIPSLLSRINAQLGAIASPTLATVSEDQAINLQPSVTPAATPSRSRSHSNSVEGDPARALHVPDSTLEATAKVSRAASTVRPEPQARPIIRLPKSDQNSVPQKDRWVRRMRGRFRKIYNRFGRKVPRVSQKEDISSRGRQLIATIPYTTGDENVGTQDKIAVSLPEQIPAQEFTHNVNKPLSHGSAAAAGQDNDKGKAKEEQPSEHVEGRRKHMSEEEIRKIRIEKTRLVLKGCLCTEACHCKTSPRLHSSMIPDNPLAPGASDYESDHGPSSSDHESDPGPSNRSFYRHSIEFRYMGGPAIDDARRSDLSISSNDTSNRFGNRNSAAFSQATTVCSSGGGEYLIPAVFGPENQRIFFSDFTSTTPPPRSPRSPLHLETDVHHATHRRSPSPHDNRTPTQASVVQNGSGASSGTPLTNGERTPTQQNTIYHLEPASTPVTAIENRGPLLFTHARHSHGSQASEHPIHSGIAVADGEDPALQEATPPIAMRRLHGRPTDLHRISPSGSATSLQADDYMGLASDSVTV